MRLYFGVIICLALCAWSVAGYGEEEGELDFDLIHHKPFKWVNAKLKETVLARLDTIENSTMRSEVKPFFGAWFSNNKILKKIREALLKQRFVVIEDVLPGQVAEQLWRELMAVDEQVYIERMGAWPNYQFHIHQCSGTFRDLEALTPTLKFVSKMLNSTAVRNVMEKLVNADLGGPLSAIYSWMKNNNYIVGHNDNSGSMERGHRRLAFVLQLSKNWNPAWGGDFVWSRTSSIINAGFNRLLLFDVNRFSEHVVTPVYHGADTSIRRLAMSGWYTTVDPEEVALLNTRPDLRVLTEAEGSGITVSGRSCMLVSEAPERDCVNFFQTAAEDFDNSD